MSTITSAYTKLKTVNCSAKYGVYTNVDKSLKLRSNQPLSTTRRCLGDEYGKAVSVWHIFSCIAMPPWRNMTNSRRKMATAICLASEDANKTRLVMLWCQGNNIPLYFCIALWLCTHWGAESGSSATVRWVGCGASIYYPLLLAYRRNLHIKGNTLETPVGMTGTSDQTCAVFIPLVFPSFGSPSQKAIALRYYDRRFPSLDCAAVIEIDYELRRTYHLRKNDGEENYRKNQLFSSQNENKNSSLKFAYPWRCTTKGDAWMRIPHTF